MKKPDKNLLNKRSRTSDGWELSLYVLDGNPASVRALNSVTDICEEYLAGRCTLEVIDLAIHPEFAKRDQIVAIPTLIKKLPLPLRRIIGDMANRDRVLVGLDLQPKKD